MANGIQYNEPRWNGNPSTRPTSDPKQSQPLTSKKDNAQDNLPFFI